MADINSSTAIFLASTLSGIACHRIVLGTKQEWDLEAPNICLFFVCSVVIVGLLATRFEQDYHRAMADTAAFCSGIAFGMLSSIFVYRSSLIGRHRLASFKGPWLAKITHIYMVALTVRKWHLYEELQALHAVYGDYVRIGPNTMSVTDPAAIRAIHGPRSRCSKGPMYDIAHPRHTLHFLRDKREHSRRRRDWRRGLNGASLTAYEPKIARCVSQLMDMITCHINKPVNAANMFNLFSFDTMGVLGFDHSFGRMKDGQMDYYMKSLHKNTLIAGAFFQMPWLVQILKRVPLFNVQYTSFIQHSRRMAEDRIRYTTKEPSIFGPVVEAYERQEIKTKQCRYNLYGDADLIVVAGSDTIAAVMSSASFCLAQHPEHADAVRRLLRYSSPEASVYIDAIIQETLRLHPVIASGLQRVTPAEGLYIGNNVYIPGNTRVQTPSYVMFRDERNFAKPNDFMPERFMGRREELVHDMSVYIPFNTGIFSCIGKQLAMKELNMALTELVKRFDFRFAPGQTEADFLRSKRDTFTLFIQDLQLVFAPLIPQAQIV